jgi:hypothetical protein
MRSVAATRRQRTGRCRDALNAQPGRRVAGVERTAGRRRPKAAIEARDGRPGGKLGQHGAAPWAAVVEARDADARTGLLALVACARALVSADGSDGALGRARQR